MVLSIWVHEVGSSMIQTCLIHNTYRLIIKVLHESSLSAAMHSRPLLLSPKRPSRLMLYCWWALFFTYMLKESTQGCLTYIRKVATDERYNSFLYITLEEHFHHGLVFTNSLSTATPFRLTAESLHHCKQWKMYCESNLFNQRRNQLLFTSFVLLFTEAGLADCIIHMWWAQIKAPGH